MIEKKYEIVSLGVNCLPRTILTRHGIKPRKADGELSCPFDLVAHRLDRIIYYLNNNFEDYFDDLSFKLRKRNVFDFRNKGIWVKEDETQFFHDKDCKINDREKLISRVSNRINNFNSIINNERPILFVLNITQKNGDIIELYNTLKKLRNGKFFKLAVLDFESVTEFGTKFNDDIYVLRLPNPIDRYYTKWNTSKFIKSALGKYFEKNICDFIKNIIDIDFS